MLQQCEPQESLKKLLRQHPELLENVRFRTPLFEQTSIKFTGTPQFNDLSKNLNAAFFSALELNHSLPDWIIEMDGMSGKKYRYFINNLINLIPKPRYLEVGTWAGSTSCAAMHGNELQVICIDNWSQWKGPKDIFFKHVEQVITPSINFEFIEADFRSVNWEDLNFNANVYLFDGPHTEQDQFDGISMALPSLAEEFILIVDDYNWIDVQNGTQRALNEFGLSAQFSIEVLTTLDNRHPKFHQRQNSDWHNGYYIAAISKRHADYSTSCQLTIQGV